MTDKAVALDAMHDLFRKVEQAKREWESIVDVLPELILLMDRTGKVIRSNRTVERWTGIPVTQAIGGQIHDIVHPHCQDENCYLIGLLYAAGLRTAGDESIEREVYDRELDRYLSIKARPVPDTNGLTIHGTVVVLQDITERKLLERAQRELIDELDAFDGMVAHDLKNPLNVIISCAGELCQTGSQPGSKTPDGTQQMFYEMTLQMALKMNSIIDELLLLTGVRKMEVNSTALDMECVVAEALRRLSSMIRETQAEVTLPEAWPDASGHAPWIEEVWVNYLSNAIKYGGRPPRIELGGEVQPEGSVRFWVRDNGVGVMPADQERLFRPFSRLVQTQVRGHGLGLSIVHRIVEKLGGQVGVESEGIPGRGSLFYFSLPNGH